MEGRDKGLKVAVVVALVISVLGVAIGFAAFSTTLEINGTATVEKANWDIHFDTLAKGTYTATEVTAPVIKVNSDGKAAAAIGDYDVKFTKPGQVATYTFNITNGGTYNAKLDTISIKTPTCTGTATDTTVAATDATNVCGKLTYELTGVTEGSTLAAGASVPVTLTLTYADFTDETLLPSDAVTVSDLDVSLTYSQAE